jgi:hypothetical protein
MLPVTRGFPFLIAFRFSLTCTYLLTARYAVGAPVVYPQGSYMHLVQLISLISCHWLDCLCKRRASRVSKSLLPVHSLYTVKTLAVSPPRQRMVTGIQYLRLYCRGSWSSKDPKDAECRPTGVWTRPYSHQNCPNYEEIVGWKKIVSLGRELI